MSDAVSNPMVKVDVGKSGKKQKMWSKYEYPMMKDGQPYGCKTDPHLGDRSTEILGQMGWLAVLCHCERPHMRAFHASWLGFFIAFLSWFAFAPLMSEVRPTLGLTPNQIWVANITSVGGTVLVRFLAGPLCDKYGARILMAALLIFGGAVVLLGGTIQNGAELAAIRFFIGMLGGTFVMCQYWSSCMFAKNIVGTANAWTAGWGNLGGGVTQIFMAAICFPLMLAISGGDKEAAWRTSFILPGLMTMGVGFWCLWYSEDTPQGNIWERRQHGYEPPSVAEAAGRGARNITAWLMFIQYACCFGVELHMTNMGALYFHDKFGLSTPMAGLIFSLYGLMNLFARTLGGVLSDYCNKKAGMKGRLFAQTIALFWEGCWVIIFSKCESVGAAVGAIIFFSLGVQGSEGTSYALVPYIDPPVTGVISGIIGAGGNSGAVAFGMMWLFGTKSICEGHKDEYYHAGPGCSQQKLEVMGIIITICSFLSLFMKIKGHPAIIPFCTDAMVNTGLDDERSWVFTKEAEDLKKKCDEEGRAWDPTAERQLAKDMLGSGEAQPNLKQADRV